MNNNNLYLFKICIKTVLIAICCHFTAEAQLSVTPNQTAAVLASSIAGPGITVTSPVLTCQGVANGKFTCVPGTLVGGATPFGINSGIMLTTGHAVSAAGAEGPLVSFNLGAAGYAPLTTLAGATTYDACKLEFDMTAIGDSVSFNYQFGSEEYRNSICGPYNDAFGFFISGPGITGSYNMAVVPGTSIPVTINSINSGVVGIYGTWSNCTSMGAGSPFTSYYTDNSGGSSFTYRGFTTKLAAKSAVIPCSTYHLILAIVDASNGLYDSGVFIEAGSLTTAHITGTNTICVGNTSSLSFPYIGGTWSSSSTAVATIDPTTGIVSGVSGGVTTITYTLASGCTAIYPVTVNTLTPITGTLSICTGSTTNLSNATIGGTWTSGTTTVATVGSTTGIVSGVSTGISTISYSLPSGCSASAIVTINPLPTAITGAPNVCVGATTLLIDGTAGGTWTSSNIAIAAVSAGGLVTGVSVGTTTITYTIGTCSVTFTITVGTVTPISGSGNVCSGSNITLSDATGGGTWSSSVTAVATIGTTGLTSGVVYSVAPGTTTISYSVSTGCFATTIVTVNPTPSDITGAANACVGSTILLANTVSGGTWSSSNNAIATVGAGTGLVTGVSAGTANITYTLPGGCFQTVLVTINDVAPIIGPISVCSGNTLTLSDATSGGTWTSGTTSVATIGTTGIVYSITGGTTTISYTSAAGCVAITLITINPTPAAITGSNNVCLGSTTALISTSAGGTWTSSNTAIATVGSTTGIVGGVLAGSATITYTLSGGCYVTFSITVNNVAPITGSVSICSGTTILLNDATSGGTWTSGTTSVATVSGTGVVTGVSGGTSTISYTSLSGCIATTTITINPTPTAITGIGSVCAGYTTVLSSSTSGGTWSSSSAIATVTPTIGIVSGATLGIATITYTLLGGCYTTYPVTVNNVAPITGTGSICSSATLILNNATTGGAWSSGAITIATINTATGVVTGVASGTASITYTSPAGCFTTTTVTINPSPTPITGSTFVCLGTTGALTESVPGGVWSSSNPIVATIGISSGIVSGISAGTSNITYALPSGCLTSTIVTVNVIATISGTPALCANGGTTTLANIATGGTWTSGTPTIATIGTATGVVYGVVPGIANITYTTSGGCSAFTTVTVNAIPTGILGTTSICKGLICTLYDSTYSGEWSSSNPTIASISNSGIVYGNSVGNVVITYANASGCNVTTTVNINALPTISGTLTVCPGNTTSLTTSITGGNWNVNSETIASINTSTGIVTGINTGTTSITYYTPAGCNATATLTVLPIPDAITGSLFVCQHGSTQLADGTLGGTWSISNITVATLNYSSGTVYAVSSGTDTLTYTSPLGCKTTAIITISPIPPAISGPGSICEDYSTTLTNSVPGGIWKSTIDSVATIDSVTGVITGVGNGITLISYISPSGCWDTTSFMVNGAPHIAFYLKPDACIGEHIPVALTRAGTTVTQYIWDFDGASILTANSNSGGPYKIMWNEPGTYVVKLSGQGTVLCPTLNVQDTIVIHKNPDATLQAPLLINDKEGIFCIGDSVMLKAANFNANYNYVWEPSQFFDQNTNNYVFGQIQFATYVHLKVTDQYGCKAQDSVYLNANSCCKMTLPNAFTPNGDGLNDIFRPISLGKHPVHSFRVLNRWGQIVYESDNQNFGWDGTFGGVPQDAATYFYILVFDCNGQSTIQKGDITLVR